MFKLALRNISSKPLRAIATILAIAVAVAMIFCMLSIKSAVYDYIYQTEVSTSGNSDIRISTNSSSDRIVSVATPLKEIEGIDNIVPSLTLYALLNDEYVQLRGFEIGHVEDLQNIQIVDGDVKSLNDGINEDNIIISQNAAEHFNLKVGDRIELTLGNNKASFYVGGISKGSGYFLDDAPYQFVGLIKQISLLLSPARVEVCNEIYIKAKDGVDVNALIDEIGNIGEYSDMLISLTRDGAYVEEQTDSLTAPVVLAGGAVLALGVAIIFMLFMMSEKDKTSLITKLSVVGASKKQLFYIFLIESAILAGFGVLIGAVLSLGVFVGLIKITLSTTILFNVSILKLFGSGVIGFVSAIVSSILPILRSFKGTIRENMVDATSKSPLKKALPITLLLLTIVSVVIEFTVSEVTGVMAIVSLVLAIATLGVCAYYALKGLGKLARKSGRGIAKIASYNVTRQKRFSRSVTLLTVGVTISIMLFMAYSLTTSIFTSYIQNFENMAFVSNIKANVDVTQFEEIEGVSSAVKMVWGQGELNVDGKDKTMNILGSKSVLDMVEFGYKTAENEVKERIMSDEPYVFVDIALVELYGVKEGDTLNLTFDKVTKPVIVGGVLQHELFSGNYIVMNESVIDSLFDKKADTVLITIDGDMKDTVGALRSKFSANNYYVIEALEMYKWDMESMNAVFDLIGTLAVVVAIFVFAVSSVSSMIGRGTEEKSRATLLNAGMSKKSLLKAETLEFSLVAIVSFVLSVAISALLTSSLIHALRLFGMYFEFMFNAWVVVLVAFIMCALYAILPLACNVKKGYNIKNGNKIRLC